MSVCLSFCLSLSHLSVVKRLHSFPAHCLQQELKQSEKIYPTAILLLVTMFVVLRIMKVEKDQKVYEEVTDRYAFHSMCGLYSSHEFFCVIYQ